MPLSRPVVYDKQAWGQQLCEHRRYLLESVLRQFPDVVKTQFTKVVMLRKEVSGPKTGAPTATDTDPLHPV